MKKNMLCVNGYIAKYINKFSISALDYVDIFSTPDVIQIFKLDECQQKIANLYELSYVNLTDCQSSLMSHYHLSQASVVFIKIDQNVTSGETKLKIAYAAYNGETGEQLDL